jgi:hypothetical protein
MALKKQPFENSLPPSRKHLFHPPFQRQRKRKISQLTPEITILERGCKKLFWRGEVPLVGKKLNT